MVLSAVLLLARLVLAAVLGLAAATKLADPTGTRRTLLNFGLPARLAPALALLLPLSELAVSLALLPVRTAWWGALGAFGLLGTFMLAISANLAQGRRPDCHCFGQLHSEPVGWPTLVRNAALAALAILLIWRGPERVGPSAFGWLGELSTGEAVGVGIGFLALLGIGALTWFLTQLLAQHGRLITQVEVLEARLAHLPAHAPGSGTTNVARNGTGTLLGLPIGSPAPAFVLPDLDGRPISLSGLLAPCRAVLLLFVDPSCGPCTALLPEAARWQREHAAAFALAVVSRGSVKENRKKVAAGNAFEHVLLQEKYALSERYSTVATPSAVLIRADGRVGSAVAGGAEAIKTLVAHTAAAVAPPVRAASAGRDPAPVIGAPAPAVRLRGLDERWIELKDFQGQDTLVLFWNPSCGFCQRMLPDLKTWEEAEAPSKPRILVVSTGTPEANRAMGLKSPVVLDADFAIGRSFGAGGTPSAVLVDAAGKIGSGVVVGAQAVLALAAPLEVPAVTSTGRSA